MAALKKLMHSRHLEERVHLKGTTRDMASVWKDTDIFAFPSHHEGFPLALSEAMAVGIPAVGYRSCSSVNELIRDGENGFLVEEGPEPFSRALRTLMEDRELRGRLGEGARESMKPFYPDAVWDSWDRLIRKTIDKGL